MKYACLLEAKQILLCLRLHIGSSLTEFSSNLLTIFLICTDKSPHKSIVVSRIDGHLIAELNTIAGSTPTILPITAESEISSISGGYIYLY